MLFNTTREERDDDEARCWCSGVGGGVLHGDDGGTPGDVHTIKITLAIMTT